MIQIGKVKHRANSLTWEEQDRLYNFTDNLADLVLFKLAITAAIRRYDIVNIELKDIDLENRKIRYYEHKKKRVWEVPILESLRPDLERYIATIPKGQKKLFSFNDKTAYNHLQRILKRASITKALSFHDLRRTCTKNMFSRKVNPKVACAITGDTLQTLQEYYDNYTTEEAREELEEKGL